MAISNFTKCFTINDTENAERFADMIEKAYQKSITRLPEPAVDAVCLKGEEAKEFLSGKVMEEEGFYVINIRDILAMDGKNRDISEETLKNALAECSCPNNPEAELFLKKEAVNITKDGIAATHMVLKKSDRTMLGYFTLAISAIKIKAENITEESRKSLDRVWFYDENTGSYDFCAYLIRELSKISINGVEGKITEKELLMLAIDKAKELQHMVGGSLIFIEAENNAEQIEFLVNENGFEQFNSKQTECLEDVSNASTRYFRFL